MRSPARPEEATMKVKVVKKATVNAKPSGFCPWQVDDTGVTSTKK
jgi:hypothetical protein